jgi:putative NADH-flavin reductase
MKIILFGASGTIGRRIAEEALARGHEVTAAMRDPAKLSLKHKNLHVVAADVTKPESVASVARGHDLAINATGPGHGAAGVIVDAAHGILAGLKSAGLARLIVVGGAGSLEVAPGKQLVDTPAFPEAYKPQALAHRDALAVYRKAELDWTYASPPAMIAPGERTGKYRSGGDQLLTDAKGVSRISAEDYAVALLDEAEKPSHRRKRFTVAY